MCDVSEFFVQVDGEGSTACKIVLIKRKNEIKRLSKSKRLFCNLNIDLQDVKKLKKITNLYP